MSTKSKKHKFTGKTHHTINHTKKHLPTPSKQTTQADA